MKPNQIFKLSSLIACLITQMLTLSAAAGTGENTAALLDAINEKPVQAKQECVSDDPDALVADERVLAELRYQTDMRVVFSYDNCSGDFGLLQEGAIGKSTPLVDGEVESLLAAFLAITPDDIPVPELLLAEPLEGTDLPREVYGREISATPVFANLPAPPMTVADKGQTCYSTYYSWWDWHDPGEVGRRPKTYYASNFGGKHRYADSYVANCTPMGSGCWLWARHRIYYKDVFGNYKKHFDSKVPPGYWQAKSKGSVKRYRKVLYNDGWDSSPNCGRTVGIECKYTREGRFRN